VSAPGRWPRDIWHARGTLRVRLTLWYVALLTIILLAFSGYLYVSLSRSLYAEIDRSLALQAQRMNPPPERIGSEPRGNPSSPRSGGGFRLLIAGTVVAVYDPSGQELLFGDAWQELPVLGEARATAAQGGRDLRTVALDDGAEWRVLTVPLERDGRLLAIAQLGRSEADLHSALDQLLLQMATAIPLTLLLAVAVGLFLAGRALDPIDRITRTADQISAEDLSRRLDLPANDDEVGRLAATFDRMLDRLDQAFQRQRQFTADASHELRTPLAMLRGQLDVALERRRPADEYEQVLGSMRDDVHRMDQLLGELLTLARADAGELRLTREPLDLGDLVTDVVAAMEPLARGRGIDLRCGEVEPIDIEADQTRLTQLVVNLLDNGMKYTPSGGSVTVSLGRRDGHATLRVADTGVGIAKKHLPHLFDRFYRVDEARSRAEGGAGLGLAISRWIAQIHGGSIGVQSEVGRGTTITVDLPVDDRNAPSNDAAREPDRVLA
jgi:heavy metal sensor kinase